MKKNTRDTIIGLTSAVIVAGLVITGDQITRISETQPQEIKADVTTYAGVVKDISVIENKTYKLTTPATKSAVDTPEAIEVETPEAIEVETPEAIKEPKKTKAERVAEIYTEEELDLIYRCVQSEAGAYDERWSKYSAKDYEMSQRLITDVILNMVDCKDYPNSIKKVICNHSRFSVYPYAMNKCKVTKQIKKVVNDELLKHTNKKVMYFRSKHYHGFGKPYKNYAGSYFSTR